MHRSFEELAREIEARLGTNKKAALGIKLESGAEICVEVITGLVIGAGVNSAIRAGIEAGAQRANAAHQFEVGVAREFRRVDGINVIKQRTIIEALPGIIGLGRLPVNFSSDTDAMMRSVRAKPNAKSSRGTWMRNRPSGN